MDLDATIARLKAGARAARRPHWDEKETLRLVGTRLVRGFEGEDPDTGRQRFFRSIWDLDDLHEADYELCDRKTWFVSGHLDLTEHEFDEHYKPTLLRYLRAGDSFIVGDAPGAALLAQRYLSEHVGLRLFPVCQARADVITVYHMLALPRHNPEGLPTVGGFLSDRARDEAMTAASDGDVAWVRPGREKSGTASNLKRRAKALAAQKDG